MSAKRSRNATTSCTNKTIKRSGGSSIFSCQFPKSTVGSILCLKLNYTFKYCITYLFCLSAFRTSCFSFPAPFTYLRCWQHGRKHIFYLAQRATKSAAQQPTGNLSKLLPFAEAAEVSRDWIESGPMGSEHWRGVLREGEVRLHVGGREFRRQGLMFRHCVGARMDKRRNV